MAFGLWFLHKQTPPVLHRDIKCENIFLTKSFVGGTTEELEKLSSEQNDRSSSYTVIAKLGDFGLSVVLAGMEKLKVVSGQRMADINARYAAPELLRGELYSTSSDVYGYGLVLWELTRRRQVFDEVGIMIENFK